jgi:hypothetical protein
MKCAHATITHRSKSAERKRTINLGWEYETVAIKRYPNMPGRALANSSCKGKQAFEDGKAYGIQRRSQSTADEINYFLQNRTASDDFERGFMEGLRG